MSDDSTPVEVPAAKNVNDAIQVPDASSTQDELNANIDRELGLEPAKEVADAEGESSTDEVEAPVVDESEGAEEAGDDTSTDDGESVDESEEVDPTASTLEVVDAAGKTYKITKVEDLPEDFVPKNNRQVIEIIRDLTRLEADTERRQLEETTRADAVRVEEQRQEVLKSWDTEIVDLQKGGRLDKPKAQAGSDGFTDDPAVKKVDAVFKLMADINNKRAAAGNPNPIRSFEDALDKYELQEASREKEAASKSEATVAKQKAGIVGRGQGSAAGGAEVYVAGSAKDIYDL